MVGTELAGDKGPNKHLSVRSIARKLFSWISVSVELKGWGRREIFRKPP